MAVTKDQVFAAADQITGAGQRPTLEAVRKITGGSYTTISPALNEWKARQAATAAPLREPAPQAVADRLAEVGAELWAIALELANARLSSEREALEKVRADMEATHAEAAELADQLAADLDAARAQIEQQAQAIEQAQQQAAQLVAAQEQAHTAQAALAEAQKRADGLAALLAQERSTTAAAQAKAEQAIAQAAKLEGMLEAFKAGR